MLSLAYPFLDSFILRNITKTTFFQFTKKKNMFLFLSVIKCIFFVKRNKILSGCKKREVPVKIKRANNFIE